MTLDESMKEGESILYLEHLFLVDNGFSSLWSEEEAGLPPPVVCTVQQFLADLKECRSLGWLPLPTVQHQFKQNIRTVLWSVHLVATLDISHNLQSSNIDNILTQYNSTLTSSLESP